MRVRALPRQRWAATALIDAARLDAATARTCATSYMFEVRSARALVPAALSQATSPCTRRVRCRCPTPCHRPGRIACFGQIGPGLSLLEFHQTCRLRDASS